MQNNFSFAKRTSVFQVEEGNELAPKFNQDGIMPCITTDVKTGELLMVGYVNEEALRLCITTGEAHYYSRSRKKLWRKGETSGLTQTIKQIRIDDDQDCLWLQVEIHGGASCHVGYRSCFYRSVPVKPQLEKNSTGNSTSPEESAAVPLKLTFLEAHKVFDAEKTYQGLENPTKL